MDGTGIVRRIDELGRLVIPKELRRTLQIRNGEQLEITASKDKELIIKKFSQLQNINLKVVEHAKILRKLTKCEVFISDNCEIQAHEGADGAKFINQSITSVLMSIIDARKPKRINGGIKLYIGDEKNYLEQYIIPLVVCGDIYGALIVCGDITDKEISIAQAVAECLCAQLD